MANPSTLELTRGSTKVGVLVPESERAMRLVVTDERYRLLDGSRFPSVQQAELTVQRFANFVDRPPSALQLEGPDRRISTIYYA